MRFGVILVAVVALALAPGLQASGSGAINAPEQRDKPYLVLVSIDGFRWDYQDLHATPALDRIAANGIRAERLIPVFPTLTFPNHYSIATGLYPAHHGLLGNRFPNRDRTRWYSLHERATVQDGSWYGGEPVWVAAEQAGMVTAAFYFVGTEAAIQGTPLSYWRQYDASLPGGTRVQQVLEWLSLPAGQRPHLLTLYFEDVDSASHDFGPGSQENNAAIVRVDGYLGDLLDGIAALPYGDEVYVVVVSDHGQIATRANDQILVIDEVADITGATAVDHGAVAFIYLPEDERHRAREIRDAINAAWKHGRAILPVEAPEAWHLSADAGFADLIVEADPGWLVYSTAERMQWRSRGDHGWAPEAEGMHGIFLACGPGLPTGRKIGAVEAVDVYPLMMAILGLPITHPIDGDPDKLTRWLPE